MFMGSCVLLLLLQHVFGCWDISQQIVCWGGGLLGGGGCGIMCCMKMLFYWGVMSAAAAGVLGSCGRQESTRREPQSPQEMYERVRELLQPNVEHDASDFEEAMVWLRRAAEGGVLQAQTDLGGIYLEGGKGGVKADGKEALVWFSKAADQGSMEALYYMGLILKRGMDVPQDEERALVCWRRAAEGGVAEAQLGLGLALVLAGGDAREGVSWLQKAAAAAAPKVAAQAACALGNIFAKGREGVARDMAEAARWYALAAQGGVAEAQLVYALMLLKGEYAPKNPAEGLRFLRLAAGQESLPAMELLVEWLRGTDGGAAEAEAWAKRLRALREGAESKRARP